MIRWYHVLCYGRILWLLSFSAEKQRVKLYTYVVDSPYFLGHYMGALHGLDNGDDSNQCIHGVPHFLRQMISSSGKNMLRFLIAHILIHTCLSAGCGQCVEGRVKKTDKGKALLFVIAACSVCVGFYPYPVNTA